MDVYDRLMEVVRDSRYDYIEMFKADRVNPSDGEMFCVTPECQRREGDDHEDGCLTGTIEEWLDDKRFQINNIARGIIRDYERSKEDREPNPETTGKNWSAFPG